MNTVLGRESQIKEMLAAYKSPNAEFVALTGRRRIGKTFLISTVYKDYIDFEISGAHKGNKQTQITNFITAMENYFPEYFIKNKITDWLEAFKILSKALEKKRKKTKKVIFLDELPWLATSKSDFLSGLSWFWNSWAVKNKIVLVVCGSAASWMIKNVIGDKGGLHNRVTRLITLKPFTLYETEQFLISKNIRLNRYQIAQIYMTIGGVPMYLNMLKPGLSATQNIQTLCFDSGSFLRSEFQRLFSSLFLNYERHVHLIEVLSQKKSGMTRLEIVQKSKMANGGMLTSILEELKLSGFIDEFGGLGKMERDSIYRLVDPYSLFYLTFMKEKIKTANFNLSNFSDLPSWNAYAGYAFENLCLCHVEEIRSALSIRGVTSAISSFIAKPKDGLPGTQIDLLIDRNDQTINLCEMKFSSKMYAVSKKDIQNVEMKKQVLAYHSKTKKHIFTTFITTHEIVDNIHRSSIDQVVLLDHLFVKI